MPERDTRICVVGDSFVQGVGDSTGQGWAGRLAHRRRDEGWQLTSYQLGVRMDTGADVLRRLPEVEWRLRNGERHGVVLSFGVNDTSIGHGIPAEEPLAALESLLLKAADSGWAALVVGPPPVPEAEHDRRVRALSASFAATCERLSVGFVASAELLTGDPAWETAMQGGDGFHPCAAGYDRWADLVEPAFAAWLGTSWA